MHFVHTVQAVNCKVCCHGRIAPQGLGATLAKYLARQGAKVIVSARSEDKLQVTGHVLATFSDP
jgi:hypothetical protein